MMANGNGATMAMNTNTTKRAPAERYPRFFKGYVDLTSEVYAETEIDTNLSVAGNMLAEIYEYELQYDNMEEDFSSGGDRLFWHLARGSQTDVLNLNDSDCIHRGLKRLKLNTSGMLVLDSTWRFTFTKPIPVVNNLFIGGKLASEGSPTDSYLYYRVAYQIRRATAAEIVLYALSCN
jgi:hypothetical protein